MYTPKAEAHEIVDLQPYEPQADLTSEPAYIVHLSQSEAGFRTISARIAYSLPLRIEATGFPTFGLILFPKP